MPAAEREKLFEPFCRLLPLAHGTGHGPNLVQDIMQIYNRRIELACNKRNGACFRLVFVQS